MAFSQTLLDSGADLQVALFFGFLVIFLVLERMLPRRAPSSDRRRALSNWGLTALNIACLGLVPVSFIGSALWAESRGWGLLNLWPPPAAVAVIATLLIRGFVSTFTHLLNHKIPWLWRLHRVHHLDTDLNVSSTVRFHPAEMFVNPFIGIPIILAFGLTPWVLALYELLDVSVTLFSHSNTRLPAKLERVLRYVIVTPDLHRIHHSSWQPETDSNYGAVFPIWDLVLGTFRAEPRDDHETMQLGLEELRDPEANQFVRLLLSPLRRDLAATGRADRSESNADDRSPVVQ